MATDDDPDSGDDTPQVKPRTRTHWTDDDRALTGAERRLTDSERRRRARSYALGVPVVRAPDRDPEPEEPAREDITNPFAVIDQAPRGPEEALARQLYVELTGNPGKLAEVLAKILVRHTDARREASSGSHDLGEQIQQLRELLETAPTAAVDRLERQLRALDVELGAAVARVLPLEQARSIGRWFVGILATGLLTAAGAGYTAIASGSERVGATSAEIRALNESVRLLQQDLRDLRNRKEKDP